MVTDHQQPGHHHHHNPEPSKNFMISTQNLGDYEVIQCEYVETRCDIFQGGVEPGWYAGAQWCAGGHSGGLPLVCTVVGTQLVGTH